MSNKGFMVLMAVFVLTAFAYGCSMLESIPSPTEVMQYPLGKTTLKVGMTKQEVESKWGKPDSISTVEDKKRWPESRDLWIYHSQTASIPIDADYLSKTRKLYFDGNYLTDQE
jgi:outer membrane protein assembly factor BamE (lipoprotein component of BamABCDE complex)